MKEHSAAEKLHLDLNDMTTELYELSKTGTLGDYEPLLEALGDALLITKSKITAHHFELNPIRDDKCNELCTSRDWPDTSEIADYVQVLHSLAMTLISEGNGSFYLERLKDQASELLYRMDSAWMALKCVDNTLRSLEDVCELVQQS